MLHMDPAQLPRLLAIEQDTHRLLAEARERGWDGEAAGLETTLQHITEKKAQVERVQATSATAPTGKPIVWLSFGLTPQGRLKGSRAATFPARTSRAGPAC
jgi:hypothetical protein